MGPPHFAEARWDLRRQMLFPPMLCAPQALASGPQVRLFAEKGMAKVKGGKDKKPLDKPFLNIYIYQCNLIYQNIKKGTGKRFLAPMKADALKEEMA
jgi:hypothetical protein